MPIFREEFIHAKDRIRGVNSPLGDVPIEYPKTAGGLLVNHASQCLLGLRSPDKLVDPLKWDIIGGHVEAGEAVEEALCREFHEELGITLTKFHAVGSFEQRIHGKVVALHHVFMITSWKGQPSNACSEHLEIGWFSFDQVPALDNRTAVDFHLLFSRFLHLMP